MRALAPVTCGHRRGIELVGRLEVEVVAHPHHQVRRFRGDGVEDLEAAAVRCVALHVRSAARRKKHEPIAIVDVLRVGARLPVRLRAQRAFATLAVAASIA